MNRLDEMLVFARAVQEGSFSAAARSLALSPSAVSKLVARLEDRLGVLLFSRSTRQVTLTAEGEAFHRAALRAIEAVEAADGAVRPLSAAGAPQETLRVRSMPTFATAQLAPLMPAFRRRHPGLRVELHLRMEPGNLLEGGMDVAIHVGRLPDSALVAQRFARTRWVICAAPLYLTQHGTPETPDALGGHECLNFLPSMPASAWSARRDAGPSRRVKITSAVTSNQGQMLRELALAGLGIVRLAEFHIIDDLVDGRLVELFPAQQAPEEDPVLAIYAGRRHLRPRVRLFLEFLRAEFRDQADWRRRAIENAP